MSKSRTIKNSQFSELIKEDGDDKLRKILMKYNNILYKVIRLNNAMNNENVKLSNTLGKSLFIQYRKYIKLQELYLKLAMLKERTENRKVKMLLEYLEDFLYKCQTGDVLSFEITINTPYGNLVDKILRQSRAKGKKTKKRKKNKKKETKKN